MTFRSFQIEMKDERPMGIGRGRWFPIASHDGFPDRTPGEWAEELARTVTSETRPEVTYRLVYVERGK